MNKLIILLILTISLSSVLCQTPSCPQDQYYNATCGKCVPCFWDIIDPPNDATFHWCRCNCYQDGAYNLRTDLCFLEGNIFSPPIQECRWRCVGNEKTSSNGTFPTLNAYVQECLLKAQCHPTCYECSGSAAWQCTKCPVGYKLTNNPGYCVKDSTCSTQSTCSSFSCSAGYTIKNSDSTTLSQANCCQRTCNDPTYSCPSGYDRLWNSNSASQSNCCSVQTCATYTCPDNQIPIGDIVASLPASDSNCCDIIVLAVYCSSVTCPAGSVLNPDNLFVDISNGDSSMCCMNTCGSSAFTCNAGYIKNTSQSNFAPASQSACCLQTCGSSAFTCNSGYIKNTSKSGFAPASQSACCLQTCGSSAFTCNSGYIKNTSKSGFAPASQSACCLQTCGSSDFTCSTGYVKNTSQSGYAPASNAVCCVKTCANPTWGTCGQGDITLTNNLPASTSNCCQPTCASTSVTCPPGKYKSPGKTYPDCCITCDNNNYLDSQGNCLPCKWDIINPPNDAIYNWCRCNCYAPGTTTLNSGVCWLQGQPLNLPIHECKWVCTENEATSNNGTMDLNTWVDQCIFTPMCDSNCYTCSKSNAKWCTSCQNYQTLINGVCYCSNGKPSHYGVCPP